MINWNKSDIGKILVYRKEAGLEEDEAIAIYNICNNDSNTVRAIEYPIKLTSKIFLLGLTKDQEKESREYLKKPGDWFYVDNATREERSVLEKIAKSPKILLDED